MEPRAELEQLLASLFDGPPDDARNERLRALLHDHPDLLGDYLDYLELHALLQWRVGKVVPTQAPAPATRPARRVLTGGRRRRLLLMGLAAAVLLAAGLSAFLLTRSPQKHTAPDLVERLVDWNLDLAQAGSRAERDRVYLAQAGQIKAALAKTKLATPDRELAETLLENGVWLTSHDDPVSEADRFTDIADRLVDRLDAATAAEDEKRAVRLADSYLRVTELGVDANLDRALASGALNAERKQNVERTRRRAARCAQRLTEILERHPEPRRKAIRRAMKGRGHKSGKPAR